MRMFSSLGWDFSLWRELKCSGALTNKLSGNE